MVWLVGNLLTPTPFEIYTEARAIHAFLLRCEGLSYQEIGDRMENMQFSSWNNPTIGRNAAWLLVRRGSRRINRAMRKTRFRWVENEFDPYADGFDPII